MSIKRSPAARVIEFFTAAPLGESELVFGLVREVIRKRKAADVTASPKVRRIVTRRKVNAKTPTYSTIVTTPLSLQGA